MCFAGRLNGQVCFAGRLKMQSMQSMQTLRHSRAITVSGTGKGVTHAIPGNPKEPEHARMKQRLCECSRVSADAAPRLRWISGARVYNLTATGKTQAPAVRGTQQAGAPASGQHFAQTQMCG